MLRLDPMAKRLPADREQTDLQGYGVSPFAGLCGAGNGLVERLSPETRSQLLDHCQDVRLQRRQVLYDRGLELRYAYFLEAGVASLTTRAGNQPPVEVHTLGQKDFVGIPAVLGMRISPHRCVMQAPGRALRIDVDDLLSLVKKNSELERILLGYVQATLIHSSQLVACNSRHCLTQRLARWLLVAQDRLNTNDIPLTHHYISLALAVRRAGVTTAIGEMERTGVTRRSRGHLVILDNKKLEAMSCDCHRVIRSAHERSLSASSHATRIQVS
jgi:CRP-like cAMP-binding protein